MPEFKAPSEEQIKASDLQKQHSLYFNRYNSAEKEFSQGVYFRHGENIADYLLRNIINLAHYYDNYKQEKNSKSALHEFYDDIRKQGKFDNISKSVESLKNSQLNKKLTLEELKNTANIIHISQYINKEKILTNDNLPFPEITKGANNYIENNLNNARIVSKSINDNSTLQSVTNLVLKQSKVEPLQQLHKIKELNQHNNQNQINGISRINDDGTTKTLNEMRAQKVEIDGENKQKQKRSNKIT